ncbi:MAG: MFS transporter [Pseudomonadota bacterium]
MSASAAFKAEETAPAKWLQAIIVAYFCLSLGLNNGFILGGLTAFDQGFLETLGITNAQLKLRDTVTLGVIGVFAFLTGVLVDKLGALRVLVIGHVLFAAAFALLSRAQSIEAIYGAQALLGICQLCAGYLVCVIAVSRLVPNAKGLAIGLMLASTSLANGVLPSLNADLIEKYGPSTTMLIIAATAIPLIIGALGVMTLKPMAGDTASTDAAESAPTSGPTLAQALRRLDFWMVLAVACLSFFCLIGLVTNLALYAGAKPLNDPASAGQFFFALFVVALITQSGAGWLADRFPLRPMHVAGLTLMTCAAIGLALASSPKSALVALVVMGFGWGFNYVFVQIIIPVLFAGAYLGRIFGVIVLAEALSAAAGPALFGKSLDIFGSYQPILLVSAAMLGTATVCAFVLHKSRPAA